MRLSLLLTLLAALVTAAAGSASCPANLNKDTVCRGAYKKGECPSGYLFREKFSNVGCQLCPVCVRYKGLDEACRAEADIPRRSQYSITMSGGKARAHTDVCGPGLQCTDGHCDTVDKPPKCLAALKYYGENKSKKTYLIRPECEPDGTYKAVQCTGRGPSATCYCVTEDGDRIFGRALYSNRVGMNCACARKYEALKNAKRTDITIHCLPNGNFAPLQCDLHLCFCVKPETGEPYGGVVSRYQWTGLPCYDGDQFPGQYNRQCESMNRLSSAAATLMYSHGMMGDNFTEDCEPDGSYSGHYCIGSEQLCKCRDRAGNNIGNYNVDSSHPEALNMDCQCARDHHDTDPVTADLVNLNCASNGNYKLMQCTNTQCYCVDKWGTINSLPVRIDIPGVETRTRCCLPCMPTGTEDCSDRALWVDYCPEDPPPH